MSRDPWYRNGGSEPPPAIGFLIALIPLLLMFLLLLLARPAEGQKAAPEQTLGTAAERRAPVPDRSKSTALTNAVSVRLHGVGHAPQPNAAARRYQVGSRR